MATTLDNITSAIRAINAVPTANVNFGRTQYLQPPYINVVEYEHEITYDTGGAAIKNAKFTIWVIDKACTDAEAVATTVDNVINLSKTLTPTTMLCRQVHYKVGQMEEKLDQFGVEISYELQEDM